MKGMAGSKEDGAMKGATVGGGGGMGVGKSNWSVDATEDDSSTGGGEGRGNDKGIATAESASRPETKGVGAKVAASI